MESTIAKEIYQEGMQEGLIKGRLETLQDNIMVVLLARFDVPYKSEKPLERIIKSIDSIRKPYSDNHTSCKIWICKL